MVSGVVNKHFKMWLWILISLNIITKVHGYGNGIFQDSYSCEFMLPKHSRNGVEFGPQDTKPPFEIDVIEGDPITVILQSRQSTEFRGFILQARKPGSNVPVGKFIALESRSTRLLRCSDSQDSAVSQHNNGRKTLFRVNWTSPEIDDGIFFRVTFVQDYGTFWRPVDKNIPLRTTTSLPTTTPSTTTSTTPSITTTPEPSTTTTPEPSTTTTPEPSTTTTPEPSTTTTPEPSTTTTPEPSTATTPEPSTATTPEPSTATSTTPSSATSTTPSSATSTTPSSATSTTPSSATSTTPSSATSTTPSNKDKKELTRLLKKAGNGAMNASIFMGGVKMVLIIIFAICLTNNPFSRRLNRVSKITCSLLCAAVEFSTLVLFCVAEPINITLIALVCMAIVINFVELVILCLPIGPSHELKEICDITVKVCSVIHQIFTIAVIFVGVMETENCRNVTGISYRKHSWLLKVMIAYTVWILLFVIWDFIICTQKTAILGRSKIGSPKWRKQQRKEKLRAAEWIVIAVSVILLVGNLCFNVAVTVGVLECHEK